MLKQILKEISKTRIYSPSSIAKNLNIDDELVKDAINQLLRMGYITEEEIKPNCDSKCSGCAYHFSCNTISIKTLTITEKGRQILNNI
ncbi:MAG TPA: FeoC-like transcriptional regulator [Tissierellaceae bacterium]